jgi:acyl-CoA synthetase (AMP-forming)/AMP-acid ligase II
METSMENLNLSLLLNEAATRCPKKPAMIVAQSLAPDGTSPYTKLSFAELDNDVQQYAIGIEAIGIGVATRTLVMLRPGFELVTVVFALLRVGAIPVFIDEGMGVDSMLRCIEEVGPTAMFGVPRALALRDTHPDTFNSVRIVVAVSETRLPGAHHFLDLRRAVDLHAAAHVAAEDLSLILFTTGSTGRPKGVQYTPRVVRSQLAVMKDTWALTEQDVDLSTFPTFVIGTIAIGMTVVVPDIDPANPSRADPRRIIQAIQDHQTTYTFGPPALWDKVTRYCLAHAIQLPSMRNILVAGAPVPAALIRRFLKILPNGACHTPMGATEANPITTISMHELIVDTLEQTDQGKGVCVGRPLAGHEIRVIRIVDQVIADWREAQVLGTDELGELVVLGPVVTHHYFGRAEATCAAKIYGDPAGIAHRLGDTGFIDKEGRVWFCGRRAHVINTEGVDWYPLQVESIFNSEPDIWRTALVSIEENGNPALALCIEFEPEATPADWQVPAQRLAELQDKARRLKLPIRHFFSRPEGFPVDIRHNSKINRPALGAWARERLKQQTSMSAPMQGE